MVESVGDGIEDYYVGGAEARGEWLGAGARELGLDGLVDGEALGGCCGRGPTAGRSLRASSSPVGSAGFDLTFSAPKT